MNIQDIQKSLLEWKEFEEYWMSEDDKSDDILKIKNRSNDEWKKIYKLRNLLSTYKDAGIDDKKYIFDDVLHDEYSYSIKALEKLQTPIENKEFIIKALIPNKHGNVEYNNSRFDYFPGTSFPENFDKNQIYCEDSKIIKKRNKQNVEKIEKLKKIIADSDDNNAKKNILCLLTPIEKVELFSKPV